MPKVQMPDGSLRDNLSELLTICPRYIIVPPNPPEGINFALCGQLQSFDDLTDLHNGISNCKPGIWKAEHKNIPGVDFPDPTSEACLRWVGELDESTDVDFGTSLEEWKSWDQKLKARFDAATEVRKLEQDLTWKLDGTYFNDGGVFATVSTAYLTREAAEAILGDSLDDEFDDDEYVGFLERTTLNDAASDPEEIERNSGFTLGGLHFNQDEIGGPPYIAVAERDGQVVAIKLFSDEDAEEEGREEGFVYDAQPGKVTF
ncbi:hypothetical protein PT974_01559 [Cladobotryum mycophilum]|uniref:Uncharacterized protein n=1 Tax=Cladobotryum mycophilum TaxID=491253 RepID=A0ABR0T4M9_9HYPO